MLQPFICMLFLFIAKYQYYSILWLYNIVFIYFVSTFWLLWIMLQCSCTSFCGVCVFCSLECIPRNGIPGAYGISMFNFLRNCKTLFQRAVPFYVPFYTATKNVWRFQFLLFSFYLFLIIITILVDVQLWFFFIVILICIFLMPNDVGHLFMCSLAICMSSLEKGLFKVFAHF